MLALIVTPTTRVLFVFVLFVTAGSADDSFDPVLIADKLKSVADALNDDPRFKAVLTDLKKAAAEEVHS